MEDKLITKLHKLRRSAEEKGNFVVSAAATQLIEAPSSLDYRINLVGALHEIGALRNMLAPYWTEFRSDEAAWANRCVARLISHDHDYWAVAALLGLSYHAIVSEARKLGFALLAVRKYERFDLPPVHVASMAIKHDDSLLVPLLELGWDVRSEELVDCARARAVLLTTKAIISDSLVAKGDMTDFCRATLPHGSWRSVSVPFDIPAEALVSVGSLDST